MVGNKFKQIKLYFDGFSSFSNFQQKPKLYGITTNPPYLFCFIFEVLMCLRLHKYRTGVLALGIIITLFPTFSFT